MLRPILLVGIFLLIGLHGRSQHVEWIQHFGYNRAQVKKGDLVVGGNAVYFGLRCSMFNRFDASLSPFLRAQIGIQKASYNEMEMPAFFGFEGGLMYSWGHGATSYSDRYTGGYIAACLRSNSMENAILHYLNANNILSSWDVGILGTEFGFRFLLEETERSMGIGIGANWSLDQSTPSSFSFRLNYALFP